MTIHVKRQENVTNNQKRKERDKSSKPTDDSNIGVMARYLK